MSAIDGATAELIFDAMYEQFPDRTMIIILHHPAPMNRVDRILSIEDGRFVELSGKEVSAWFRRAEDEAALSALSEGTAPAVV